MSRLCVAPTIHDKKMPTTKFPQRQSLEFNHIGESSNTHESYIAFVGTYGVSSKLSRNDKNIPNPKSTSKYSNIQHPIKDHSYFDQPPSMKNIHAVPIPFIGTYGALAMVAKRKQLPAHTSQPFTQYKDIDAVDNIEGLHPFTYFPATRKDQHTIPKYVPGTVKKNRNENRNGKESTRLGRIL